MNQESLEKTVFLQFQKIAKQHPNVVAQKFKLDNQKQFQTRDYQDLYYKVLSLSQALLVRGLGAHEHVALISNNNPSWILVNLALDALRVVDVPRGTDLTERELVYILQITQPKAIFLENQEALDKFLNIQDQLESLSLVVLWEPLKGQERLAFPFYLLDKLLEEGHDSLAKQGLSMLKKRYESAQEDDLATIIFTSGTTGEPKGVMLTQRNLMYQVENRFDSCPASLGDVFLSVLPIWHIFERLAHNIAFLSGATTVYSKPIPSVFLEDLKQVHPSYLASVPRIWYAVRKSILTKVQKARPLQKIIFHFFYQIGGIYMYSKDRVYGHFPTYKLDWSRYLYVLPMVLLFPFYQLGSFLVFKKVRQTFGSQLKACISGGGSLSAAVEAFYRVIGIPILNGYGMTEAAPGIAMQPIVAPRRGTVGKAFSRSAIRIVDEHQKELSIGRVGVVQIKGPQVMQGYYKRPKETASVLKIGGWLHTGDLGMLSREGDLKLVGRAKDTIVLMSGENVEPVPMENKLEESLYIAKAIIVGQGQKFISALIVPNVEQLRLFVFKHKKSLEHLGNGVLLKTEEIQKLMNKELRRLVNPGTGFKLFESVKKFTFLEDDLEVKDLVSAKKEPIRHKVEKTYQRLIAGLYKSKTRI